MPDTRVQAAIDNWGPRLIANGVDYNDFVRTTAAITRWEDWLEAWTAPADVHRAIALGALQNGHRRSAGEAFLRAAVSYHFAKFVWVLDRSRNRSATEAAVRALYEAHALLDPTAERIEAPPGDGVVLANLRRPACAAPVPLVLLIPGLDSTKEDSGARSEADARERAGRLSLAGVAVRISLPCLVVTGKRDRIVPWEETRRIADEAPRSEWVLYDEGTHVCNNIPFKYRPLVADWLRDRLA